MSVLKQMFGMAPTPLMNYAPEGLGGGFNTVKQLGVDPAAVMAVVPDNSMIAAAAHDGIADGPV